MSDSDVTHKSSGNGSDWRARLLFPLIILSVATIALLFWLILRPQPPTLSRAEVSGTAEAIQFATSEPIRQATLKAMGATGTALSNVTQTAEAYGHKTASAQAARTSTALSAQASRTAQALVTRTALAQLFETALSQAEATVATLDGQATQVHGPSSGALEHRDDGLVACTDPYRNLRDFIAEATFHNPQPQSPSAGVWDYGIIFSKSGDEKEYRIIVDSDGSWLLNLHSPSFDITNSDKTGLLDLAAGATNSLKLYVTGDVAYLYINGRYVSTLNLSMLGMGHAVSTLHTVQLCVGIRREYSRPGRSVLYSDFTLWSLPR